VCGTDAEFFSGEMAYLQHGAAQYPIRIGHEWCGVVSALGDGVDPAWLGRRVIGDTMLGCGSATGARPGGSTCAPTGTRSACAAAGRAPSRAVAGPCPGAACACRTTSTRPWAPWSSPAATPAGRPQHGLIPGERLLVLGPRRDRPARRDDFQGPGVRRPPGRPRPGFHRLCPLARLRRHMDRRDVAVAAVRRRGGSPPTTSTCPPSPSIWSSRAVVWSTSDCPGAEPGGHENDRAQGRDDGGRAQRVGWPRRDHRALHDGCGRPAPARGGRRSG
jgi:hypothetical protein